LYEEWVNGGVGEYECEICREEFLGSRVRFKINQINPIEGD